jgi:4-amino-4-deoxy-L-arabinose transferase-like glycosyltransferase
VFAAALAIKALIIFCLIPDLVQTLAPHYGLNTFADLYDRLAKSLADGQGYRLSPDTAPSLMREPGYPLFLSMLFRVFGYGLAPAQWANLLLSLLVAWGMVRILLRLSESRWVLLAGPLLFLFHPATVIAESRGGFELLFMALLVWFVVSLLRALDDRRSVSYLIAGILLGGAVLVKSTPILFPFSLLPYLLIVERKNSRSFRLLRNITLLVGAMALVLSPWIIRNYRVSGKFIPTASILGISAHSGQHICKHHSDQGGFHVADTMGGAERRQLAGEMGYEFRGDYYQLFYSTADEIRFSQQLLHRVIDEYRNSPSLFLRCTVSNVYHFWFAGRTQQTTLINLAVQLPYLALATAGAYLWILRGGARIVGLLLLFIIYYMGLHLPILAQARYATSLLPFLGVLGAGVFDLLVDRIERRWADPRGPFARRRVSST